jgi:uncharacterized protein
MNRDKYIYKRNAVDKIEEFLYTDDVIVLHGARQVGKTCILRYIQESLKEKGLQTYYIDLEDSRYVKILDQGVSEFIKHLNEEGFTNPTDMNERKLYVFIDEIQYLENPSSFLKLTADHHSSIKLIVSGSSSFNIKKKFKNSLVGRTVNFEIMPLSFDEYLLFKGVHFEKENIRTEKKTTEIISHFKSYICHGGYPRIALTSDLNLKEKYLQQIIDTYIKKDISDLASIRNTNKFNLLVETLAAQSGQILNVTELSNTCGISKVTIENYLFVLEETYIIKLIRPYSNNIRSELFKTPKIFFYDSGLMQMLWLKKLQSETIGNAFETCVFSELAKKHGRDNIYYWRTKDKREIDFILKYDGNILPIEVKLNFNQYRPNTVKFFSEKYNIDKYKVIALNGEPFNEHSFYPWDL